MLPAPAPTSREAACARAMPASPLGEGRPGTGMHASGHEIADFTFAVERDFDRSGQTTGESSRAAIREAAAGIYKVIGVAEEPVPELSRRGGEHSKARSALVPLDPNFPIDHQLGRHPHQPALLLREQLLRRAIFFCKDPVGLGA